MIVSQKPESVYFSVKGQVVIPRRLRDKFETKEGTRAYVEETPEGIFILSNMRLAVPSARKSLELPTADSSGCWTKN